MKNVNRFCLTAVILVGMSGAASAQTLARAEATPAIPPVKTATPAPAPAAEKVAAAPAPAPTPATAEATPAPTPTPATAAATPAPEPAPARAATPPAPEQQAPRPAGVAPSSASFPVVTFGIASFLQYEAQLHESNGYNAFDVTRGYLNIEARLNDRVRVRFTPNVRPTTDADLNQNLALRMEYASLDVRASDSMSIMFGLHEMPWLAFEESVNRYRVIGPFFSERLGLIPGVTDLGVSVKNRTERTDIHVGVYNGEGQGRAEIDKYKSIDGRATFRPFSEDGELGNVSISGFYQYGWYARDRPRNVAIVMGSYEVPNIVLTAQYLSATDNPFVAVDVQRRGMSFFGELRQGLTGWAGVGGLDLFVPDANNDGDSRRRLVFGGARWSQVGRARLGVVVTLDQTYQTNSQLLERRLLGQTHIEF
ncbi:MAG TPA: hypothetical protein VI485_16315 [Vicinamibacterales bacterium]|nr:hypothetical protein [Vicinamibacterales bacterium]